MRLQLGHDLGAELEAPELPVLGIVLDEEAATSWMELRRYLDDGTADGEHAGAELDVAHAQFGQLAPAQSALDIGLDQEPPPGIWQGIVHGAELLRREDRV